MIETPVRTSGAPDTEYLRAELARGDALAGTVLPILRHLLSNDSGILFGDEILAQVRAMLSSLARELLDRGRGEGEVDGQDSSRRHALTEALLSTPTLLSHLHAQALEWALTERLEALCGVDPVVPPLLQHWIASPERALQSLATRLLAAQARWCQAQRRMTIDLHELPGETLHAVLLTSRSALPDDPRGERAEAAIRERYDEGATRIGIAARFVSELGDRADAALELEQAGATLFITTLALYSGEARDAVTLATHEVQPARLALTLLATGLTWVAAERQIGLLHPQTRVEPGLALVDAQQAADILRDTRRSGA
jgi:hypothetical protein